MGREGPWCGATDGLGARLRRRVIGQDDVVEQVVDRLSVAELGHRVRSDRPRAVLLFAGATGVGKTELARALAAELDPEGARIVRLDMAEYGAETDVWKIISPPPGILGHGTASPLLRTVAEHPDAVVLLDEVEKAHPAVHRLFLRVMDDGVLTQSNGAEVRFGRTTIVMTTNALSRGARRTRGFGFEPDSAHGDVGDLDGVFAPEFVGRLDAVCRFRRLDVDDAERIVAERLIPDWLRAHPELRLTIAPGVARALAVAGHDTERGVRELERIVERRLMLPVARALRAGESGHCGLIAEIRDGRVAVGRSLA